MRSSHGSCGFSRGRREEAPRRAEGVEPDGSARPWTDLSLKMTYCGLMTEYTWDRGGTATRGHGAYENAGLADVEKEA
eukprot:1381074-Amorphochlora_amoeboformis.AAC.1